MRAAQVDGRLDAIAGTPLYYGTPGTTEVPVDLERYTVAIVGSPIGSGESVLCDSPAAGAARFFASLAPNGTSTRARLYTPQYSSNSNVPVHARHCLVVSLRQLGDTLGTELWVDGVDRRDEWVRRVRLDGPTPRLRFGRSVAGDRLSTVHAAAIWQGNLTPEQAARASAWLAARHG